MKKQFKNMKLKALACSFALGTLVYTGMASADIHIKFHHDLPEDSAQHLAAERFRDMVAERSGGEISVEIFPNNTLGDDVEVTQQLQMGAVEAAIIPTAKLSGFVPAMQIVDLPFLCARHGRTPGGASPPVSWPQRTKRSATAEG
ncbi:MULTISPECIES: TRAP transporter substrate-binding protein [Halomonadaceae]|uniref:Uncharacterized protein n=1 Tax=Vreelandella titanicae TaxID=664683 RepID=A0AAP9NSS7_9GAMM|nr:MULTISPECIES: TRAP transporter substrate-binding protein DctP [Halomonas]QKS27159.1 hypothetical protein FX987_04980 [Halomonas titanicae]SDJ13642.1 extracellular solute-binding protein, family 7 [Halomonas titanicae]